MKTTQTSPLPSLYRRRLMRRKLMDRFFSILFLCAVLIAFIALGALLWDVLSDGVRVIFRSSFFTNYASQLRPNQAGILAPVVGSALIVAMTAAMSLPIGVGTAVYLEEFANRNKIAGLIQLNISNLAGVPSVVYGLLGLALFVQFVFSGSRNLISGALTLTLLILPIVIIASQEAIRAVPSSRRDAAFAMGATRWQVVRHIVLPEATPGIMSGVILALSRAIGESAPILIISSLVFITFVPTGLDDRFTVLPLQIYNWISQPKKEFHELAAGAIIVLLAMLLIMNSLAIWIRSRTQRRYD